MSLSRNEFVDLALEQIDAVDRLARSLTRNGAEADDLVQETYLHALKAHPSFKLESFGIRPWLFRILHNLHVNRVKRERRQPAAREAEQLEAMARPVTTSDPLPATAGGELAIQDEALDAALDALPADLRTALVLWAVDDLTYNEIAQAVGIPIGTVMSRLHRARRRLGELLAGHPYARPAGTN